MFEAKLFLILLSIAKNVLSLDYQNSVTLNKNSSKPVNYRLPNNTYPIRYDLFLHTEIHRKEFNFLGNVAITFKALENTNNVTLHSRSIDIKEVGLTHFNYTKIPGKLNIQYERELDFMIIVTSFLLLKDNEYKLNIQYTGTLRSDNFGFYRSSYFNKNNEEVFLATTQFQHTEARTTFPCYDEPGIRAIFSIDIRHHKSYFALSNMPVKITHRAGDYMDTIFEDTLPMQTYLLAFVISDYGFVENKGSNPPQRVYARNEAIEQHEVDFALDVGVKLLSALEEHFSINYTLPKMDQVAVPDFFYGAMEHWG